MSAKKIPITPIFKDLPTVAQVVTMSTATIERLEREGQFPKRRFAGNGHPSPNRSLRRSTTFSARPNSGQPFSRPPSDVLPKWRLVLPP